MKFECFNREIITVLSIFIKFIKKVKLLDKNELMVGFIMKK